MTPAETTNRQTNKPNMNAPEQLPLTDGHIAAYSPVAAGLAELRHRFDGVVFDVSTTKGEKEARGFRKELVTLRTTLESKRKELKAPALAYAKRIDDEAKTITAALLELEEPIDAQIKAEEARKEAERAAKAEAERQRIARHQAVILYLRGIPADVASASADKVLAALNELEALDITSSLEEFQGQAQQTKDESLAKLREMHAAAVAHEAEQARIKAEQEAEAARIAAERAELARLRAEAAERERAAREARAEEERAQAAKLAAEREAQEAELRAAREAQERELAAQRAAQAKAEAEARAAREAEEQRLAAERAELRRQQEEAEAQRRAAEEAKHAADMKARNAAPAPAMLAALRQIAEVSTEAKVQKIAKAALAEAE